jgi:hypothetical protein
MLTGHHGMNHAQTLADHRATAAPAAATERRGNAWILPALTLSLGLAWLAARGGWYKPGDDFGYYLCLVGGVMMLLLLLYPLRKHIRFLGPLGAIRHWFRMHMVFGIAGPLLIVIHSGFTIGSFNAGVALTCMLLVAGSGVLGRFIYTRIHHGLYGRKATLQEMQTDLGIHEGEVRSKFHFAPKVEGRLRAFGDLAHSQPDGFIRGIWQFLTIGLRARHAHGRCMHELRRVLGRYAAERDWERAKLRRRLSTASEMIRTYLKAARNTAQFGAYERLFSLWHILHVPFVFMLVVSGVVHVIAVHMY